MRNSHIHPNGRRRPAPFGPRADAQFTVDVTVGPAPRGRSNHGEGRRGRGHGRGPGGFGRGPGGPGGPGGRGRRAGRGDVRAAILLLLAEQPMHGYQIIQEITERTSGAWTPSPGAVYPAIGLLTDEGLVTTTPDGGRNLASLTDEGRAYIEANTETLGNPWESAAGRGHERRHELRSGVGELIDAVRQVGRVGSDAQVTAALAVLDSARRDVYLILAEPDGGAAKRSDGAPVTEGDDDAPSDGPPSSAIGD